MIKKEDNKKDLEKELLDENFTCWSLIANDVLKNLAIHGIKEDNERDIPSKTVKIIGYDPYILNQYDKIKEESFWIDHAIEWINRKIKNPAKEIKKVNISNIHDKNGEKILKNGNNTFKVDELETAIIPKEVNKELFDKYNRFREFRYDFFDNVKDMLEEMILDYNTFNLEESKLGINLIPVINTQVSNKNINLFDKDYIKVELIYTDKKIEEFNDSGKGRIDELFVFDLNDEEVQQIAKNHPDKKLLAHNINTETFQNKFYKTILQSFDNKLSAKDKMILRRRKYNKIVKDYADYLIEQIKSKNIKIAKAVIDNFNDNDLNKNYFLGISNEINYLSNTHKLAKKALEKIYDVKKTAYQILRQEQKLIKNNQQADFYEFDKNMNELKETNLIFGFEAKNRKMGSILQKYENLKEKRYHKPINEKPKTEMFR